MTNPPIPRRRPVSKRIDPIAMLNEHMAASQTTPRWQHYFAPVKALSGDLPVPILGIMLLIWQLRDKDLQQLFPLQTRKGRLDFVAWCILHGCKEYQCLRQADALWQAADSPVQFDRELAAHDAGHAISWKMMLIAHSRRDIKCNLATSSGRQQLVMWYLLYGRHEMGFADEVFQPWQVRFFFSASATPRLNHLQELIYLARPDVRQVMPLPDAIDRYINWFRYFLMVETKMIDALRSAPPPANKVENQAPTRPDGVNVIGYAFGQLGIGEDARMAFSSLQSCAVPAALIDFQPGNDVAQNERSLEQYVTTDARYNTNMFCITALENGRFFAERGCEIFTGRFNIGYWPWELAKWPQEWQHLFSLVDEVWASSPHTMAAAQESSPVPVKLMPMAVTVDATQSKTRTDFALPQNACLFLFVFDLNSSAKRKNPKACLDAFLQAFPVNTKQTEREVGVVIKVHPPKGENSAWQELKTIAAQDRRIYLIEQTLSKEDLLALYNVCDCFVSLHRAEGFGRCIAEVMALGKPVISTDYSGSLAFTNAENAFLVPYRLKSLAKDDYPYGWGQVWAEPKVPAAAAKMQVVHAGREIVKQIADRGQQTICQQHSLQAIGQRYFAALQDIWAARATRAK